MKLTPKQREMNRIYAVKEGMKQVDWKHNQEMIQIASVMLEEKVEKFDQQ